MKEVEIKKLFLIYHHVQLYYQLVSVVGEMK